MKTWLSLLLLVPTLSWAQTATLEEMVADQCSLVKEITVDSANPMAVAEGLERVSLQMAEDYGADKAALRAAIAEEHPNWDDFAVKRAYEARYYSALLDACPHYITLTRTMLPPCPPSNATNERLTELLAEYLEANAEVPYQKQYQMAQEKLGELADSLGDSLTEDYPNGLADPQTKMALGMYLMHHCDPFTKSWMVSEVLRTVR